MGQFDEQSSDAVANSPASHWYTCKAPSTEPSHRSVHGASCSCWSGIHSTFLHLPHERDYFTATKQIRHWHEFVKSSHQNLSIYATRKLHQSVNLYKMWRIRKINWAFWHVMPQLQYIFLDCKSVVIILTEGKIVLDNKKVREFAICSSQPHT